MTGPSSYKDVSVHQSRTHFLLFVFFLGAPEIWMFLGSSITIVCYKLVNHLLWNFCYESKEYPFQHKPWKNHCRILGFYLIWWPWRLHILGSVVATWWGHHLPGSQVPTEKSFWNVLWGLFDLWGLCIKLLRPWGLLLQCNFANTSGKECNLLNPLNPPLLPPHHYHHGGGRKL